MTITDQITCARDLGRVAHGRNRARETRWLLAAGVAAGPLFVAASVLQGMARGGFVFTDHHRAPSATAPSAGSR